MSFFPESLRAYWIRRDRELYLLTGVAISSIIASIVSGSWHAEDHLRMLRSVKPLQDKKVESEVSEERLRSLQDGEFAGGRRKVLKKYYDMDSDSSSVPNLEEEEGE